MTNDAARIATSVEQTELTSNNPGKAGLAKLREEYTQLTATGQGKDVISAAMKRLDEDGALDAIVDAWVRAAISPGESVDSDLKVYKDPQKDAIRSLSATNDLEHQLGDSFSHRFYYQGLQYADTTIKTRWWHQPAAGISGQGLDKTIEADNHSIELQRVAEQLKVDGPKGPLWKTLIGLADSGKITEQTLDRAYTQHEQLNLSTAQEQALTQLKAEWNSETGVKPFRIETTTRFVTGNPLNSLNPLYGMNPMNHMSPWNHDVTTNKQVDYLGAAPVDRLLEREFNGSTRPCDLGESCTPAEDAVQKR